jgi:hypothetical protein
MNVSLLGDQNSFWLMCVFVHGLDQGNSWGADGVHPPNACLSLVCAHPDMIIYFAGGTKTPSVQLIYGL